MFELYVVLLCVFGTLALVTLALGVVMAGTAVHAIIKGQSVRLAIQPFLEEF